MSRRLQTALRRCSPLALIALLLALVSACTPAQPGGTPGAGTSVGGGTLTPAAPAPTAKTAVNVTPAATIVTLTPPAIGTRPAAANGAATPARPPGVVPSGPLIYSTNGRGFSLIDAQTGQVISTINTGFDVRDIAVSPDGRLAYLVVGLPKLASLPGLGGTSSAAATTPTVTPPSGTGASPPSLPAAGAAASGLVVYDLSSKSQVGRIAVGSDPWAVVLSRDGSTAYVSNRGDGTVSVVDTASRSVTATLTVGSQPTGLAILDASAGAIVATVTSTLSATPVAPPVAPAGTAVRTRTASAATPTIAGSPTATSTATPSPVVPRGRYLYVANYGGDDVSTIDLATNRVLSKASAGTRPIDIAADASGMRVFVANLGSSDLSVISIAGNQTRSRVRLGGRPSSVAVSDDGRVIYVALIAPTNAIQVVDPAMLSVGGATTATPTIVGTPGVGMPTVAPAGTAVRTATASPATPTAAGGPTATASSTPGTTTTRIPVGNNPSDIVFNGQGTLAFTANAGDGTISVIDTTTWAVVATIQVAGQPSSLHYVGGTATATRTAGTPTPGIPTATPPTIPVATVTATPTR